MTLDLAAELKVGTIDAIMRTDDAQPGLEVLVGLPPRPWSEPRFRPVELWLMPLWTLPDDHVEDPTALAVQLRAKHAPTLGHLRPRRRRQPANITRARPHATRRAYRRDDHLDGPHPLAGVERHTPAHPDLEHTLHELALQLERFYSNRAGAGAAVGRP